MDIKERLAQNDQKAKGLAARLAAIEQEKQALLQELFKLEGECRVLQEMEQGEKPAGKTVVKK